MPTLSVIIPVYNEQATIEQVVRRVLAVELPGGLGLELILVDDCSTDASSGRMQAAAALAGTGPDRRPGPQVKLVRQDRNRGKGAAVRLGAAQATGQIVLIQDADLEYDPADYPALLGPILAGEADVVYGSRFADGPGRRGRRLHLVANRMLTWLSNAMTGLRLTDMETCYKVFSRAAIDSIEIRSERFELEPELTAKVARGRWRLREVPISYAARGYAEGKKIGWRDGVKAILTILRYRFFDWRRRGRGRVRRRRGGRRPAGHAQKANPNRPAGRAGVKLGGDGELY